MQHILPAIAIFTASLAAGQSISAPLVAVFRDDSQHLRRAVGVPGNLIVPARDGTEIDTVWTSAFTGKSGLVKTARQLLVLDEIGAAANSFDAPDGDALFAFSRNGMPAFVFFAATGEVWRVDANGLQDSPMPTAGLFDDVLAIDGISNVIRLVVRSGEDFYIAQMNFDTGEIVSTETIPPVSAAIMLGRTLLLADATGLLLRATNGALTRIETAVDLSSGVHSLQRVSADQVRVALQDESYLLRMTANGAEFTRIPEARVSQ